MVGDLESLSPSPRNTRKQEQAFKLPYIENQSSATDVTVTTHTANIQTQDVAPEPVYAQVDKTNNRAEKEERRRKRREMLENEKLHFQNEITPEEEKSRRSRRHNKTNSKTDEGVSREDQSYKNNQAKESSQNNHPQSSRPTVKEEEIKDITSHLNHVNLNGSKPGNFVISPKGKQKITSSLSNEKNNQNETNNKSSRHRGEGRPHRTKEEKEEARRKKREKKLRREEREKKAAQMENRGLDDNGNLKSDLNFSNMKRIQPAQSKSPKQKRKPM